MILEPSIPRTVANNQKQVVVWTQQGRKCRKRSRKSSWKRIVKERNTRGRSLRECKDKTRRTTVMKQKESRNLSTDCSDK